MVDTKLQPRKPLRSKSSDDAGFTDKYFGGKDLSKQQNNPAEDEGMMSDASSSRRRRRATVAGTKPGKDKSAVAKSDSKGHRRASVASYLPKDDEGMMSDASTASTRSRRSGRRPSLRMTTDVAALSSTRSLMKKDPSEQDSETEDSILLPNPHDTPQKKNPTRPATARSTDDDEASYMSDASSRSRRRGRRMSLRLTTDSEGAAHGNQSLMKGAKEDASSDEEDLFAAASELPSQLQQQRQATKTPNVRRGTINADSPTKRPNHNRSPRKGVGRTRSASPFGANGSRRTGHHKELTRTRSMSPSAIMGGKRRGGKKQASAKSPRKSPHKSPPRKKHTTTTTTTSSSKAWERQSGLAFDAAEERKQRKKKSNREDISDDSSSESDDDNNQGWNIEAIELNFGKHRSDDVDDDDEEEEREKPRRKKNPKKSQNKHSNDKHNRKNKDKKVNQSRQQKHQNPKRSQHHHDDSDDSDNKQSKDTTAPQFEVPIQLEICTLDGAAAPVSPMTDGMEVSGFREKKLCANDFKNMSSATNYSPNKMLQADKEKQKLQDQLKVASAAVTAWESDREQHNHSPTNGRRGSVRGLTRQLSNIFKKKNKDGDDSESDNESVSSSQSRRVRRAERFMHHRLLDDDSVSDHSSDIF